MKITVLGSSHGNPTPGHFQTSVLIGTCGRYYLVDAAEPVNALLVNRGLCAAQIEAAFITHMHIDHTGGLPSLLMQAGKFRPQFPERTLQLYLPDAAAGGALSDWIAANGKPDVCGFAMHHISSGSLFNDGAVKVSFIPTAHIPCETGGAAKSYAILLEAENKKILFTGDLAADFSDFPWEAAGECDLIFCELTHFKLADNVERFKRLSPEKLVFYHVHTPHQSPEGAAKIREVCSVLPYPVVISADGEEVFI